MTWVWSKKILETYLDRNPYSKRWAELAWNNFMASSGVAAASFKTIIDMGCGPGDITEALAKWKDHINVKDEVLVDLKKIRDGAYQDKGSVEKLIVGTDISVPTIDYCRNERKKVIKDVFGDHVKLSFEVADSADPTKAFWKDNMERFDLVTSFTAFHWIADQKKALECVATCLKPGGHFLIFLPLKNDIINTGASNVKAHPKWNHFLRDANIGLVPWDVFMQLGLIPSVWNPSHIVDAYEKLASEVGLQVESSNPVLEELCFEEKHLRMVTMAAFSRLLNAVPDERKEDLLDDIIIEISKVQPPIMNNDKMQFVSATDCLIVWGVKK